MRDTTCKQGPEKKRAGDKRWGRGFLKEGFELGLEEWGDRDEEVEPGE